MDVKAWVDRQSASRSAFVEIEPPTRVARPNPKTIYSEKDWRSTRWHQSSRITCPPAEIAAAFVAAIPDGRLVGPDGAVITPDDAVLTEVSVDLRVVNHGQAEAHLVRHRVALPPIARLYGTVAALAVLGGHNYFHWMFHLIPRIELLRRAGVSVDSIGWFATNEVQNPFQEETLAALGVPRDRVFEVGADTHVKAETLLVPSRPSRMSDMPLWACDFLRRTFLPTEDGHGARPKHPSRIYLTRENCGHRKIRNEGEVREFLEKHEFTPVLLESMSVAEQARLLNGVAVVVAPHGAGLANLVFCRPRTTVVEIFSPRYINCCYWLLCNLVKADYHYILGTGDQPTGKGITFDQYDDITVDISDLSRVLQLAGG